MVNEKIKIKCDNVSWAANVIVRYIAYSDNAFMLATRKSLLGDKLIITFIANKQSSDVMLQTLEEKSPIPYRIVGKKKTSMQFRKTA